MIQRATIHVRAAVLVLVALALLGCSGDESEDAAGSTTSTPPETTAASPAGSEDPFCAPASALGEGFGDITPTEDPEQLREQFAQAREAIAQTQAEAPAEVQDDIAVLAEGYDAFIEELEAVDYDFTRLSLSALTVLDSPEMVEASENLDAYRAERCGAGA